MNRNETIDSATRRTSPTRWLGVLARKSLDVLIPPLCLSCRRPLAQPRALCAGCWSQLTLISAPLCDIMGTPLPYDAGPDARSAELRWNHPLYDKARAAVVFDSVSRRLVHQLKYHDVPGAAQLMATLMAPAVKDITADADVMVPVPLHRTRLIARRFNQAVLIADQLSPLVGVPVARYAVQRTKRTPYQVGLKREDRANNLHDAFEVKDRAAIAGRHIVLVDDVLTTGATADALAWTLRAAGARSVRVAVFARVIGNETAPA